MPRTEISSGTQRSVIEHGLPFLTSLVGTARQRLDLLRTDWPQTLQRTRSLSSGHVVRYRCKHRAPAWPRVRSVQLDDCRGTDKTASLYTASYYRTFAPRDICLRLRFGDIRVWPGGVIDIFISPVKADKLTNKSKQRNTGKTHTHTHTQA